MLISKNIRLGFVSEITGRISTENIKEMLKLLDTENLEVVNDVDMTESHERVEFNDDVYYVFHLENRFGEHKTSIYKLLPNVVDDDLFKWTEKYNGYRKTMWCKVTYGIISFAINYRVKTGDATIYVKILGNNVKTIHLYDQVIDNKILKAYIEDLLREWKTTLIASCGCEGSLNDVNYLYCRIA